ncbi:kinase-like domain-containing protein [Dissophora ornata]|nr:kinase-like domain-containing protein [Dissophora ornata]
MTTSRTRSGKRPTDWADFYKNGPPQEVIVIDDSTPPPSSSSASSSTSSHHHQVPGSGSSSRQYHHRNSHHDPYQLGSSPRSHAMPPPPPTSSHHPLQSAVSNGTNGAHYHPVSESEGRGSRRSNKRQPSADLMLIGSNGSSYSHPTTTSSQQHHYQQHPPYHPQTGSHDPHHYGYSGQPYSQSHHYPPHTHSHRQPPPPSQQYHHHHQQQQLPPPPPPHHATNSAYSNDYGPPPGSTAANVVPQTRKRRKSNSDVKYIAPPPPPASSASHGNQGYSGYYHPPASGPSAANHAPTPSRGALPIIPPWDDKEGHYIVIPNEDLISRYKIIRLLGQGTFGKVVECYDRETGRHCAIKIIRAVQKYRDASKIEARVLNTLKRHDPRNSYKCLHLDDCFDYRNHVCMVFELLGQSIYDWLKDNAFCPFPPNQIQQFARQLLSSVAFLHRLRLIHTDLKPENILLANGDYRQVPYRVRHPIVSYC